MNPQSPLSDSSSHSQSSQPLQGFSRNPLSNFIPASLRCGAHRRPLTALSGVPYSSASITSHSIGEQHQGLRFQPYVAASASRSRAQPRFVHVPLPLLRASDHGQQPSASELAASIGGYTSPQRSTNCSEGNGLGLLSAAAHTATPFALQSMNIVRPTSPQPYTGIISALSCSKRLSSQSPLASPGTGSPASASIGQDVRPQTPDARSKLRTVIPESPSFTESPVASQMAARACSPDPFEHWDSPSGHCDLVGPRDATGPGSSLLGMKHLMLSGEPGHAAADHDPRREFYNFDPGQDADESDQDHPIDSSMPLPTVDRPMRARRLPKALNDSILLGRDKLAAHLAKNNDSALSEIHVAENRKHLKEAALAVVEEAVPTQIGPDTKKTVLRCFVPGCRSKSSSCLLKFGSLTRNLAKRREIFNSMCKAIPQFVAKSLKSGLKVCELHYDESSLVRDELGNVNKILPGSDPCKFQAVLTAGGVLWNEWAEPKPHEPKRGTNPNQLGSQLSQAESQRLTEVMRAFPEKSILEGAEGEAATYLASSLSRKVSEAAEELAVESSQSQSIGAFQDDPLDPDYVPPLNTESQKSENSQERLDAEKRRIYKEYSMTLMMEYSNLFVGVPEEIFFIVHQLAKKVPGQNSFEKVMVTLRKIRLNETFELLGKYFCKSSTTVCDYFNETIPTLAACLKELVFKPDATQTLLNLPLAFRYKNFDMQYILDCFEIQVSSQSDAYGRASTYSSYKGCTTVKYLVSITPDVFCNYISQGYGGRTPDTTLTTECDFMNLLEPDEVMAVDRGFKGLEPTLRDLQVAMRRPPSIYNRQPMSASECNTAKEVAALRIHVERYIGRLRAFAMLAPHACINAAQIPTLDLAVVVAAGLTNLKRHIIRVD